MRNKFGTALREARRRVKKNLFDLAEAANVTVAYVSQIERGDKNPPKVDVIRKWLKVLNCEERLSEFVQLAASSVRSVSVATKGKSQQATNVLTALARSYEQDDYPDDVWAEIERLVARKGKGK